MLDVFVWALQLIWISLELLYLNLFLTVFCEVLLGSCLASGVFWASFIRMIVICGQFMHRNQFSYNCDLKMAGKTCLSNTPEDFTIMNSEVLKNAIVLQFKQQFSLYKRRLKISKMKLLNELSWINQFMLEENFLLNLVWCIKWFLRWLEIVFIFPRLVLQILFPNTVWFIVSVWNLPQ